jgi:hypothetical protein
VSHFSKTGIDITAHRRLVAFPFELNAEMGLLSFDYGV